MSIFLIIFCWCIGNDVIKLGESEYHLASTGSGTGEKTTAAELVRRMISDELRQVLGDNNEDTYIAPLPTSSTAASTSQSSNIANIGYDTLTRVVREELRRFRADAAAALQPPDVAKGNDSSSSRTANGRGEGGYERIDDVINDINERDHAAALGGDGQVDDSPQHPPPLPPLRRDSPPTESADGVTGSSLSSAAEVVEVDGDSVRHRRVPVDDTGVIQLLERIEQSTAELDASFTALVNVGLQRPGDWQRLARELPICRRDKVARRIALIEARYRHDMKRQAAAALAEWRSYRRDNATLRELVAALKRCDLLEEALFLDSMSKEPAI